LPQGPERDVVLTLTYGIVVFSILMQGLTIGHVANRAVQVEPADAATPSTPTAP
jgi:CPA1 family monovalent cation:H+ antiporter